MVLKSPSQKTITWRRYLAHSSTKIEKYTRKICTAHKSFIPSKRNAVMKGWSIIIILIANISEQSLSHYNMSLLHIQSSHKDSVWLWTGVNVVKCVEGTRIAPLTTFCLLHTIESLDPHLYWNNDNIPSFHELQQNMYAYVAVHISERKKISISVSFVFPFYGLQFGLIFGFIFISVE